VLALARAWRFESSSGHQHPVRGCAPTEGHDPAHKRKTDRRRAKIEADNSFAIVATEFIDTKMAREGRSEATLVKARWFLDLLRPSLGQRPITAIEPAEMLEPLDRLEGKGFHETARRFR
jgi:integrase-like protein